MKDVNADRRAEERALAAEFKEKLAGLDRYVPAVPHSRRSNRGPGSAGLPVAVGLLAPPSGCARRRLPSPCSSWWHS